MTRSSRVRNGERNFRRRVENVERAHVTKQPVDEALLLLRSLRVHSLQRELERRSPVGDHLPRLLVAFKLLLVEQQAHLLSAIRVHGERIEEAASGEHERLSHSSGLLAGDARALAHVEQQPADEALPEFDALADASLRRAACRGTPARTAARSRWRGSAD